MSTDRPRPGESDAELGADCIRDDDVAAKRLDADNGVRDDEAVAEGALGDDDLDADRVRDDEFGRDFGAAEPPDPLGQAMPDITEAHIAEAGPDGPTRRRPSRSE